MIAGWGVMNLVALTERRMQFAYAVTHELRTPLTTFRLYSDMLSAGLVPEDRRQEDLDPLNRESVRHSTMVESGLESARLENRQARLHLRETDGTTLLHTVGETLDKRCAENGVEGRKVNEIRNGLKIRTDVDLVSQITGVLINNACRHARSAKTPAVLLRLGGENGRVTVDVVDSGPGVDRADSRRIFKPFRRGRDADKAARGGIGLGLALARNWASLLGGRLDLVHRHDPELGGAHFRLSIPTQTTES
jgi:signal transduction histidine kinase